VAAAVTYTEPSHCTTCTSPSIGAQRLSDWPCSYGWFLDGGLTASEQSCESVQDETAGDRHVQARAVTEHRILDGVIEHVERVSDDWRERAERQWVARSTAPRTRPVASRPAAGRAYCAASPATPAGSAEARTGLGVDRRRGLLQGPHHRPRDHDALRDTELLARAVLEAPGVGPPNSPPSAATSTSATSSPVSCST
jgi:hypothetical protein